MSYNLEPQLSIKFINTMIQNQQNSPAASKSGSQHSIQKVFQQRKTSFAVFLFLVQGIIIIMYGLFVRPDPKATELSYQTGYPFYQDVNVMMLIGFGFLMTFVKTHQWSALSYTFFINAIVVQLYTLLQPFWHRVFHGEWEKTQISIGITTFTAASYSVASILIAFGGVLGRVGPLELLIMAIVGVFGYTLNEDIVYGQLKLNDAGGSTAIHTYGAYFGLATSAILSKIKSSSNKSPQTSHFSNTIAVLGTFFLWMFWPSFNAGYFPVNPFERSMIVTNTICSLAGSCLATFALSSLLRHKLDMEDILNATLAGGVAIGAPAGLITNSVASVAIGLAAGTISTLGYISLSKKLNSLFGLEDTCGINNLHGIPGILGGILSAIVVASYNASPINPAYQSFVSFYPGASGRTFTQQAGYQLAGTGTSLGFGLLFGFIAGMLISCFYRFQDRYFFEDRGYFSVEQVEKQAPYNRINESSFVE